MKYYYLFMRGDDEPFAWRHTYEDAVKCRDYLCKELHYDKSKIAICRPKGQNDGYYNVGAYTPTKHIERYLPQPSYPNRIVKLFREKYGIQ